MLLEELYSVDTDEALATEWRRQYNVISRAEGLLNVQLVEGLKGGNPITEMTLPKLDNLPR
jgi:hypothetical protein